jgi:hypothetical protein
MKYKTIDLWCKSVDINSPVRLSSYRKRKYVKFFAPWVKGTAVLDIGGNNAFGMMIANSFKWICAYNWTAGDLNHEFKSFFDFIPTTIFCFEVIEHLLNPSFFLHQTVQINAPLLISYPRWPEFLWLNIHFHEFRDAAFFTLAEEAGYEIAAFKKLRIWHNPLFYLSGFRPFIRFWLTLIGVARHRFAVLIPKGIK